MKNQERTKREIRCRMFKRIKNMFSKSDISTWTALSDFDIKYDNRIDGIICQNWCGMTKQLNRQDCIDLKNFFEKLSKIC